MKFNVSNLKWINEPTEYSIEDTKIVIKTEPGTDLWQRTFYKFRNDNAPILQMETDEKELSFTVKTTYNSKHNFDQAGIALYLDSENWLKASVEYGDETWSYQGAVVSNHGYSDWSSTRISTEINSMWFRLSRRGDDFCVESSLDGRRFEHYCRHHLEFAICLKQKMRFVLAYMLAALKTVHFKRFSVILK